jgi:hypothetical protein
MMERESGRQDMGKIKKSTSVWILGITLILFNILFFLFRFSGDTVLLYVSGLLPVASSILALVFLAMAFSAFRTMDFIKASWILLFIGIFLFFLGESTYAYQEIILKRDMKGLFPSISDIFWCAGYVPQFLSLAIMLAGYRKSGLPMGKIATFSIVIFLFMALCSAIIYHLLIPIIRDPEPELLTKIFSIFYPIADMALAGAALALMYITGLIGNGSLSASWKYISLGFILFTVADLAYSYLSYIGQYENDSFIDIAFNGGYLLIALSAAHQKQVIESANRG